MVDTTSVAVRGVRTGTKMTNAQDEREKPEDEEEDEGGEDAMEETEELALE